MFAVCMLSNTLSLTYDSAWTMTSRASVKLRKLFVFACSIIDERRSSDTTMDESNEIHQKMWRCYCVIVFLGAMIQIGKNKKTEERKTQDTTAQCACICIYGGNNKMVCYFFVYRKRKNNQQINSASRLLHSFHRFYSR